MPSELVPGAMNEEGKAGDLHKLRHTLKAPGAGDASNERGATHKISYSSKPFFACG